MLSQKSSPFSLLFSPHPVLCSTLLDLSFFLSYLRCSSILTLSYLFSCPSYPVLLTFPHFVRSCLSSFLSAALLCLVCLSVCLPACLSVCRLVSPTIVQRVGGQVRPCPPTPALWARQTTRPAQPSGGERPVQPRVKHGPSTQHSNQLPTGTSPHRNYSCWNS
jgi:hypothetical protein